MGWNYLCILKLQLCNRRSLEKDTLYHPTLYWACLYLSMLGLKLIHVSKMDPWPAGYLHWSVTAGAPGGPARPLPPSSPFGPGGPVAPVRPPGPGGFRLGPGAPSGPGAPRPPLGPWGPAGPWSRNVIYGNLSEDNILAHKWCWTHLGAFVITEIS